MWGASNNRPMSTATVSSFLNAGGWSAWPKRIVGLARPLASLAAQGTLLLAAAYQLGQLLAASVGKLLG
jgi:hypothetical protein